VFPASQAFLDAVSGGSYTRVIKLESLDPVTLLPRRDLTPNLIDGSVDGHLVQDVRRTISITIANEDGAITPVISSDPYWINNPLRLSWGVVYQDGTTEYVPLGTFLVNRAWARGSAGQAVLDVDAVDFWKKLQYTALLTNASYAAGSTLKAALEDLCTKAGIGPAQRDIDPSASSVLFHGGNAADLNLARGTAVADCLAMLTEDFGWIFFFDTAGIFVARPGPVVGTAPVVFTMTETGPMVTGVEGGLEDSADIKNHVGVSSTDASIQPIFAEAKDNNQNSPTYVGGAFGDRYFEYQGEFITTLQQAQDTAKNILARRISNSRKSDWMHAPRPELDIADVGRLTSAFLKISGVQYQIESFTIPLVSGSQRTSLTEIRTLP
jgi:hypothetical protein